MLELLHQVPLFSWLPEEGAETLSNCFDLCVEELNAGETRGTEGRIGCLLRGSADFRTAASPAPRTGRGRRMTSDVGSVSPTMRPPSVTARPATPMRHPKAVR